MGADFRLILKALNPRRGRVTGAVYLLYFLTAIFAQFLVGRTLAIYSDTANLIATACYVAVVVLFYDMFKPVSRALSCWPRSSGSRDARLRCLTSFIALRSTSAPFIFWTLLLHDRLPYLRSTFLPRTLGVMMMLAGLGWLAFLSPLANHLSTYIKVLGILAEGALMLWLLVLGVNVQRWKEQARGVARESL